MKIVVINLERSPERRRHMASELRALALDHEFFPAVDASRGLLAGVSRYDEARALRVLGQPLTPAEVGTFASHYLLWKRCAESAEPLIVMEDDLRLQPPFADVVRCLDAPLRHCGFIRLHGLSSRQGQLRAELPGGHRLVRYLKGPRGAQCYALHPRGARALLHHAGTWIDAVDLYLDAFWIHGMPSYAVEPFHVQHLDEAAAPSTIGRIRWAYRRTALQKARRELTHAIWSLRRYWFNYRYALARPAPPGDS